MPWEAVWSFPLYVLGLKVICSLVIYNNCMCTMPPPSQLVKEFLPRQTDRQTNKQTVSYKIFVCCGQYFCHAGKIVQWTPICSEWPVLCHTNIICDSVCEFSSWISVLLSVSELCLKVLCGPIQQAATREECQWRKSEVQESDWSRDASGFRHQVLSEDCHINSYRSRQDLWCCHRG